MFDLNRVVLTDGPLDCPFAPKKANAVLPLIAGIVGAASSIGSTIMNLVSQADANTTNERIADKNIAMQRETNEMNRDLAYMANRQNYRMFQEQNAFNLDMWNKQNQYNLPSAQVQRLLAAGINPATGLGQVTPASSLTSATPAPQEVATMQAPHSDFKKMPINYDFSGIGDAFSQAVSMKYDMDLKQSEINYNNAKAEYEWQSMESRLRENANRADLSDTQKMDARRQYDEFMETWSARKQAIENGGAMSEKMLNEKDEQIRSLKIANDIDSKWKEKMTEASYNEIQIGIKEAYSRIKVNDAEAAYKAAETAVAKAREEGLKISNEQADELVEIIVDKAEVEAFDAAKRYYGGDALGRLAPGAMYTNGEDYEKRRKVRKAYRKAHRK